MEFCTEFYAYKYRLKDDVNEFFTFGKDVFVHVTLT